jgi:hypothetical protein
MDEKVWFLSLDVETGSESAGIIQLLGELARFEIPEKFLPVVGPEYSRNRNFDRNFDFVPVISGVF